jgi:hypothetical protein
MKNGIGTLRENSLHADLKTWYSQPGDRTEEKVGGYVIDLIRGEQLIEIQTRHFHAIKKKLIKLLEEHPVRVIYPIAAVKMIVREDLDGNPLFRRRSPLKGRVEHLFNEMVRIPTLALHPNFSLEVVFTQEEEARVDDGRGSWRRKGVSITDRRLVQVTATRVFQSLADYQALLPEDLPLEFTAKQLARAAGIAPYLSRKMAYTLREMGLLEVSGRKGKAYLYQRTEL